MPLVSVIIPTLNRYVYLKDVFQDLEKQTYKNFEVIVVDQTEPFQEEFYQGWNFNLIYWHQKDKALLLGFDRTEDVADYFEVIAKWGFDHSTVRQQSENLEDQISFPFGGYKVLVAASKIEGKGLLQQNSFKPSESFDKK